MNNLRIINSYKSNFVILVCISLYICITVQANSATCCGDAFKWAFTHVVIPQLFITSGIKEKQLEIAFASNKVVHNVVLRLTRSSPTYFQQPVCICAHKDQNETTVSLPVVPPDSSDCSGILKYPPPLSFYHFGWSTVFVLFIEVALAIVGLNKSGQLAIQSQMVYVISDKNQQVIGLFPPADSLLSEMRRGKRNLSSTFHTQQPCKLASHKQAFKSIQTSKIL